MFDQILQFIDPQKNIFLKNVIEFLKNINEGRLTHIWPIFPFGIPRKHQKT